MSLVARVMCFKRENEPLGKFAARIGVTHSAIRNWVLGDHGNGIEKTGPRIGTAIKIAHALGVTVGWLVAGELPKYPCPDCGTCEFQQAVEMSEANQQVNS